MAPSAAADAEPKQKGPVVRLAECLGDKVANKVKKYREITGQLIHKLTGRFSDGVVAEDLSIKEVQGHPAVHMKTSR